MQLRFFALASAASVSLLFAITALADGTIRDGVGARSIGRGGTNLAMNDNGHLMLDNPAGLVGIAGDSLIEFGGHLLMTDLTYSDPDNTLAKDIDNPFPIGEFSIAKRLDENVMIGFGVFSHGGFASEYVMNGQGPFAGPQHSKSIAALARILPTLSLRLTDQLSVGATLGAALNHIELEGPYTLQGPNGFAGTPTRMDVQGTGVGASWSLGMQYRLSDCTTVGVSYQHETDVRLDGTTLVEIPGLGQSRYQSKLDVSWPRTLGVGIAHRTKAERTFSCDAIWFDWSSAHDQFNLTMTDPDDPTFAFAAPALLEAFPLNWRDTVSLRFGFQQTLANDRTFRAGYVYHRNPIPEATLTPFIQTTVEHIFSVGYGWTLAGMNVDAAYQLSLGPDQSVGQSGFLGGDFDNSTSSATAHQVSISFQRSASSLRR